MNEPETPDDELNEQAIDRLLADMPGLHDLELPDLSLELGEGQPAVKPATLKIELLQEQLRILQIRRESKELDLRRMKKELLPRDLAMQALSVMETAIQDLADNLDDNLQRLGPQAVAKLMTDKIDVAEKQIQRLIDEPDQISQEMSPDSDRSPE